jgi:hypothetical protein
MNKNKSFTTKLDSERFGPWIIEADEVPDNIYIVDKNKWKFIVKYIFDNGLVLYYGTNYFNDENDEQMAEMLECNYGRFEDYKNPSDYQAELYAEYDIFMKFENVLKVWQYYEDNKIKILSILKKYT